MEAEGGADLVLVPGVAFGEGGQRLGRGRGYYDRWLDRQTTKPITMGLALGPQLRDDVPVAEHDVRLDHVIAPMDRG